MEQESLKRIVDFNRLMDGENRNTADPDDMKHWKAVYSDLVNFKRKMLDDTREHIAKVPATEKELGVIDVPFLEAEMQRLQRGLTFWEGRLRENSR